jgi:uncharacterized membrane protein YhaH (DUF805 family)
MDWYLMAVKRYAEFSGRSRRKEYWMFILFNMIISFALGFADAILGLGGIGALLAGIYVLGVFIPSIAVGIRRLHDTGRSGWWLLVSLVPVIGLILLFFLVQDSEPGANEYGPNPKTDGQAVPLGAAAG